MAIQDKHPGINAFIHCAKCLKELPVGQSPRGWARLEVGLTDKSEVIVWCTRHEMHVASFQMAPPDRRTAPRAPHDSSITS